MKSGVVMHVCTVPVNITLFGKSVSLHSTIACMHGPVCIYCVDYSFKYTYFELHSVIAIMYVYFDLAMHTMPSNAKQLATALFAQLHTYILL